MKELVSRYAEPWNISGATGGVEVLTRAGRCVVGRVDGPRPPVLTDLSRIVDCVNACAGLSDEQVEKMVTSRSLPGFSYWLPVHEDAAPIEIDPRLMVACTYCHAVPFQPCIARGFGMDDSPCDYFHASRQIAAKDARAALAAEVAAL